MAKKPKTRLQLLRQEKQYKIQKFEQPIGEEKKYIRKTFYMLMHPNYIKLSNAAKVAYEYIMKWGIASKSYVETGKFEFSANLLANKGLMTYMTARTAIKELVDVGFLKEEYKHGKGFPNRYSFSDRWYTNQPETPPEIDDYESVLKRLVW